MSTRPHDPDEDDEDLPIVSTASSSGDPTMAELETLVAASLNPQAKKLLERYKSLQAQKLNRQAQAMGSLQTKDPLHFFMSVLGIRPTQAAKDAGYRSPITADQARICISLRDNRKTAVQSAHGVGKTYLAGLLTLWCLYSLEDTIVVTTATNWNTVQKQIWAEIHAAFRKAKIPLQGRMLETELRLGDKWYATGLSTDQPERITGFHSRRVIVIIDEAGGYPEDMWDAIESLIVGPHDRILAIGNTTNIASKFKRVCDSGSWNVIRVDGRQHPNVLHNDPAIIPGAISRDWIADRLLEYGSEEAPLYQARVCGFWPTQGVDSLISLSAIETAQAWDERHKRSSTPSAPFLKRYPDEPDPKDITHARKGMSMGLDIAGPGSDLCVLSTCEEGRFKIEWWTVHRELMETVGKVLRSIREREGRVRALALDDTGIGNGVSSRLLELQRWAQDDLAARSRSREDDPLISCSILRVNFAEKSDDEKRYHRKKDQLWWQIRDDLLKQLRGLPPESEFQSHSFPRGVSLVSQLVSPIYEVTSTGAIIVYDKRLGNREKSKTLPLRSPDIAHSIILANHAYRFLRADAEVDIPKNIVEMRTRKFAKEIEDLMKPKDEDSTTDPYKYLNG